MSKVSAPIFNATVKPPAIFGLSPVLAVLVLAGGVLVAILIFVLAILMQSAKILPMAPVGLFATLAIGFPIAWKLSISDCHYLEMKLAVFRFSRNNKKRRTYLGALVPLLVLLSTGDSLAQVSFRPEAALGLNDWLPLAASLIVGVTALGYAVAPAVVSIRPKDKDFEWIEGGLEFDHILADKVTVQLKDGGLFRVFEINGLQYTTRVEDDQRAELNRRRNFFNSFRDSPVTGRIITRQYPVDRGETASYPSETLQNIGDQEKRHFSQTYAKKFYLILSVEKGESYRKPLLDACKNLNTYMASYGIRPIEASATGICPLTTLLSELVNGSSHPLSASARSLSLRVGRSGITFDFENGDVFTSDGISEKHEKLLILKEFGDEARGDLIRRIMELPAEIEFNIRFQAVPDTKSKYVLGNQEKQAALLRLNLLKAEQFQSVYSLIDARVEVQFRTEMSILVKAGSKDELSHVVDDVMAVAGYDGLALNPALGASAAFWFGRLPGYERFYAPLFPISGDLAAFCSFSREPAGDNSSVWGPGAIRRFKTARSGVYSVQYHVDPYRSEPVGHYAVIAPSDSGKTTLMMHLMGGMMRHPNTKGFVFDSKEGARFTIEAMGGRYFDLNNADKIDLNPLHCADTIENRDNLRRLIQMMSGAGDDASLDIISRAVEQILAVEDFSRRSFSKVYKTAFDQGSKVQLGMKKWVVDPDGNKGPYARLLNGQTDALTRQMDDNFLIGWNSDQILKEPEMAAPVFEHILRGILSECKAGGFGFNIFVDEAAALFKNDAFRSGVEELFREVRKNNGIVGVAFQEPSALSQSDVADAVFTNCSTFFLFPNTSADRNDYRHFNLNDEQWGYIKGMSDLSNRVKRSVMMIKRDKSGGADSEESVILDIDLGPIVGPMIKVYQSGSRAVDLMKQLQNDYGKENLEWVNHL